MSIQVIPFEPRLAQNFKQLNLGWIRRYFVVEPENVRLFENCEQSIITTGGHIYFAQYQNTIHGCFALLQIDEKTTN